MSSSKEADSVSNDNSAFNQLFTSLLSDFILSGIDNVESIIALGLEKIARFYDVDEAFIGLFDEKTSDWSYFFKWTESEGTVGADDKNTLPLKMFPWSQKRILSGYEIKVNHLENSALLKGKPDYLVYLETGLKSILIEPLSVKRKIVPGVIALWSRKREVVWAKDDSKNLSLLGDVLANLIDARIVELERINRERYITILNKFTQYAFEVNDFHDVLNKMSADLCDLMRADFCGFGLLDENRKTVVPIGVAGINANEFLKIGEIPVAGSMTERVLRTGKRLVLENVESSDFRDNIIKKIIPIKSFIVMPIKTAKKRFGSFIIGYCSEKNSQTKKSKCASRQRHRLPYRLITFNLTWIMYSISKK